MTKRIIELCYRKIINITSLAPWERIVFEESYKEFLMQAQFYNQDKKYSSFSELLINVPQANRLHGLVSTAVIGYLRQLKDVIPDIVNVFGNTFLPFKNFKFEIINSDINNKSAHVLAISFYSDPLLWHDTINNKLLVSTKINETDSNGVLTEMFEMQPMLSIYLIKAANE